MSNYFFKNWISFLLFLLSCFSANSSDLNQPNAFYKKGDYEGAILAYQKLIQSGYQDASLYYNLGNAYFKNNQLGWAILNYERAKKLHADDEDVLYNLRFANLRTIDKISSPPQLALIKTWNQFFINHSATFFSMIAISLLWISLLCFLVYLFLINWKRFGFYLGLLFFVLSSLFFYLSFHKNHVEENPHEAILVAANIYVKSAPDAGSVDLFILHEGTKMQLLDQVGEWYKIKLADGKVGWVNNGFEKI